METQEDKNKKLMYELSKLSVVELSTLYDVVWKNREHGTQLVQIASEKNREGAQEIGKLWANIGAGIIVEINSRYGNGEGNLTPHADEPLALIL